MAANRIQQNSSECEISGTNIQQTTNLRCNSASAQSGLFAQAVCEISAQAHSEMLPTLPKEHDASSIFCRSGMPHFFLTSSTQSQAESQSAVVKAARCYATSDIGVAAQPLSSASSSCSDFCACAERADDAFPHRTLVVAPSAPTASATSFTSSESRVSLAALCCSPN